VRALVGSFSSRAFAARLRRLELRQTCFDFGEGPACLFAVELRGRIGSELKAAAKERADRSARVNHRDHVPDAQLFELERDGHLRLIGETLVGEDADAASVEVEHDSRLRRPPISAAVRRLDRMCAAVTAGSASQGPSPSS
jgi:hypothetical protein